MEKSGPKTRNGKLRSSRNAAKHWIESHRILPHEEGDAAILRSGLIADFKPEGLLELEVIEDLTFNRVIKRRIDEAFTREFQKAAFEKTITLQEKIQHSATQYFLRNTKSRSMNWATPKQAERVRPAMCISGLESLKSQIINGGPDPQDLEDFRQLYGDQPTENAALAMYQLQLLQVITKQAVEDGTGTFKKKEFKRSILKTLDDEIQLQRSLQEVEAKFIAGEIAWSSQEPPRTELETLLRYRAANVRELRELLHCFERIRRLRGAAA